MSRLMMLSAAALCLGVVLAVAIGTAGVSLIRVMIPLAFFSYAAAYGVARSGRPGSARRALIPLLLGMALLGALRWYAAAAALRPLPLAEGQRRPVQLKVRVAEVPSPSAYRGFRWRGEVYGVGECAAGEPLVGRSIEVYSGEDPLPGDEVIVRGDIFLPWTARNPGEFDYRQLLRRRGIGYLLSAERVDAAERASRSIRTALLRLRRNGMERILTRLAPVTGEDAAAVVGALLTGERGHISDEMQENFRTAGLAHLLAISGLHVMAIGGAVRAVLRRLLSPAAADPASGAVVFLYAVFAGGRPSVIRAAFLFGAQVGAARMRRRSDPLNLLAACGGLMLLQSPRMVFDVGFQLSFGAFWALVSLRPVIERRLPLPEMPTVRGALALGLSVWLVIVPLSLHHFGSASWLGLFVNPLVTPLFCLVFFPVQLTALGAIVGLPAEVLYVLSRPLAAFLHLVGALGRLPGEIGGDLPTALLLWILATLLAIGRTTFRRPVSPSPPPQLRSGRRGWGALAVLWLLTSLLIIFAPEAGEGPLRVTVFDVGQGDCILIEGPRGGTFLVDTGPPAWSAEGAVIEEAVLPYLRGRGLEKLDHLLLTHGHLDHTGGTEILLREFEVGQLWLGPMCAAGARLECEPGIAEKVQRREISVRSAVAGKEIDLDGVNLSILWPEMDVPGFFDLNEASVALMLRYGGWSMLLLGDVENRGDRALVELYGRTLAAAVLKVGHHGSAAGSTAELLSRVNPEVAVISVGTNPYGHPAPSTVARLRESGARVIATQGAGAIILETDGSAYRVMSMLSVAPDGQEVDPGAGKMETAN